MRSALPRGHFLATNMIKSAIGWGVLAAAKASVGAVANSLAKGETHAKRQKRFYASNLAKGLAKCIWKVFGKDANLLKEQTSKKAPTIITDLSIPGSGQVAAGDEAVGRYGQIRMMPSEEFVKLVRTDVRTGKDYTVSGEELWNRSYVHELGNKLNRDEVV